MAAPKIGPEIRRSRYHRRAELGDNAPESALAQLVEHRIRNAGVGCSNHPGGTTSLPVPSSDLPFCAELSSPRNCCGPREEQTFTRHGIFSQTILRDDNGTRRVLVIDEIVGEIPGRSHAQKERRTFRRGTAKAAQDQ